MKRCLVVNNRICSWGWQYQQIDLAQPDPEEKAARAIESKRVKETGAKEKAEWWVNTKVETLSQTDSW